MEITFRKCGVKDIDELQELSTTTFAKAFEHQNNSKDFKAYVTKAFSEVQLLAELKNPHTSFYFADRQGKSVGYFKTNVFEAQSELQEPVGMELERIYVRSINQGKGIGLKILSFVESLAQKDGKSYLWLGVWEHNRKAIRFYERHGYIKFNTHPFFIGNDKQTDWLLKKELK
ncbi:MAG: GNAT family N-acetyltransferase [Bacteroidota bacterium]